MNALKHVSYFPIFVGSQKFNVLHLKEHSAIYCEKSGPCSIRINEMGRLMRLWYLSLSGLNYRNIFTML